MMDAQTKYLWNGSLGDRALEREYCGETQAADFKTLRIACILTSIAYLGAAVANYITFSLSTPFVVISALRVAAFTAAMVTIISTYKTSSRKIVDYLVFINFVIIIICDSVELSYTPSDSLPELPGLVVILLVYYVLFPNRLILVIIGGLSAGISFSATAGLVHGFEVPIFANSIISLALVNAFGAYHVRNRNLALRMKFMALKSERQANVRLQQEIAQKEKIQQELFEQATIDDLTKVYNRRFFLKQAEAEFSRSRRHQISCALIMIDLDHFKAVNDSYGHDTGDLVLQVISARIRENLREEDLMGRLGGEEFAVLLPDTDLAGAMKIAERIRGTLEARPAVKDGTDIKVTASLGAAAGIPGQKGELAGLIKSADDALYSAKHQGRNRAVAG